MKNKIIAIVLIMSMLVHSVFAPVVAIAQDVTPEPSATPIVEITPSPSETTSPTPVPTPTPTMSPDEYDAYKIEKQKLDDEAEARDKEWDAHENDPQWVAEHGGNQANYISGAWTPTPSPTPVPQISPSSEMMSPTPDVFATPDPLTTPDPLATPDPFASPTPVACASPAPSDAAITNDNCAVIDNTSQTNATSGENVVSGNDGNAVVTTGNTNGNGNLQNNSNTNVSQGGEGLTVDNTNTAIVDNQMSVEGTSGNNTVTENDGDVTLTTGDVELIANMLNILNLNVTGDDFLHLIVNIFGQLNGTLDLDDIAKALGYSDDDALKVIAQTDETADAEMSVDNTNNAVVNNELDVTGTSGGNNVSGNDGTANVVTGRIQIMANLLNFINANFSGDKWRFIMVNVFGSLNGDIIVPGTQNFTSADGAANAQNTTDQTNVANTNNVTLANNVNTQAVTGNNQQNGNDDEGHTTNSGQASVETNILNFLNMNITGNNWVFLIVNVFGKWMGQIVGFGGNTAVDAPESGTFAALSTGAASGDQQTNNTTAINNNNTATVNNQINATGVSGQNSVNGNDGQTSIETGWVEIDANLLNIINTNISGRSWMVVFLNVFGNFMGNLFFGQPTVAAEAEDIPEIGGAPEQNSSSNTTLVNQSGNNSSQSNPSPAPVAKKPKLAKVLSLETEEDFSEGTFQAEYDVEVELSDDHQFEKLGFLGLVMQTIGNIMTKIRGAIAPMFAHVVNLLPLS